MLHIIITLLDVAAAYGISILGLDIGFLLGVIGSTGTGRLTKTKRARGEGEEGRERGRRKRKRGRGRMQRKEKQEDRRSQECLCTITDTVCCFFYFFFSLVGILLVFILPSAYYLRLCPDPIRQSPKKIMSVLLLLTGLTFSVLCTYTVLVAELKKAHTPDTHH